MQPREKILAGALAAVIAFFLLRPAIDSWFLAPIRDRNTEIKSLQQSVQTRTDQEFEFMAATKRMAAWRDESLPPDPLNAQRVYQEWLTDVALISGWEGVEISLGSRTLRGPYTGVVVTVEGRATLDEVNSFLKRVEETQLLQRIVGLDLDSPSFDGNPPLNVTLTAEGLALTDAAARTRLFPTTGLAAEATAGQTTIQVTSAEGFPEQTPFRIRIDDELLDVLETGSDGWKVERGVAGTVPAEHLEDVDVELLPLRVADSDEARQLLPAVERLFVKYRPRTTGGVQIAGELPPAAQGKPWTTELDLQNWDTAEGTPIYKLGPDAPSGMFLDAELGKLSWTPADDAELREYDVPVAVYGADEAVPVLETNLTVEVRVPNTPPELRLPRQSVSVWLGRPFTYKVQAEDEDLPNDRLQFSLTGEDVPEGLRISGSTGMLVWTPSAELPLGEVEVEVSVTDDGSPPETDTATLTLDLQDDAAGYTYYVGYIIQGDKSEAWLLDRTTNRRTKLYVGDPIEIADITGTVESIERDYLRIRTSGQLLELASGANLRSLKPVAESVSPVSVDAEEPSADGVPAEPTPEN